MLCAWGKAFGFGFPQGSIDTIAASAPQSVALDHWQHIRIAGHRRRWQALQQWQHF